MSWNKDLILIPQPVIFDVFKTHLYQAFPPDASSIGRQALIIWRPKDNLWSPWPTSLPEPFYFPKKYKFPFSHYPNFRPWIKINPRKIFCLFFSDGKYSIVSLEDSAGNQLEYVMFFETLNRLEGATTKAIQNMNREEIGISWVMFSKKNKENEIVWFQLDQGSERLIPCNMTIVHQMFFKWMINLVNLTMKDYLDTRN